jgi:hypothetical protein
MALDLKYEKTKQAPRVTNQILIETSGFRVVSEGCTAELVVRDSDFKADSKKVCSKITELIAEARQQYKEGKAEEYPK